MPLTSRDRTCEIVIDKVNCGNVSNFPVLISAVSLPSEILDADGSNPAQANGGDIIFTSDSTGDTRLSCEIVSFTRDNNPALGTAEIWVKVTTLSSSVNTSIWIWYKGNGSETQPAANAAFGSQDVWSNSYVGVWHLENGVIDSTGINSCTDHSTTDVVGQIGRGRGFLAASTRYIDAGNASALNAFTTTVTMSAWVKPSANIQFQRILSKVGDSFAGYELYLGKGASDTRLDAQLGKTGSVLSNTYTSSSISTSAWTLVHGLYDGADGTTKLRTLFNGVEHSNTVEGPLTSFTASDVNLNFGRLPAGTNYFSGSMDEIHVASVRRAADWVTTEYNNQFAPSTFAVAGSPSGTSVSIELPTISITI